VIYKSEIISITEYLNTKYAEDRFVNTVKSHKSNQPNMNSKIKVAAKDAEKLTSEMRTVTKKEGIQHKSKIGRVQRGMAFDFRKTATAVINPER
jgi:hypothetical protein